MAATGVTSIMLPALKALSSGEAVRTPEIPKLLSASESEEGAGRAAKPATTKQIADAVLHMQKAGLVKRVSRGVYRLTDRGKEVLDRDPVRIDFRFLRRLPEYVTYEERVANRNEARKLKPEPTPVVQPQVMYQPPVPTMFDTAVPSGPLPESDRESKKKDEPKIVKSPYAAKPAPTPKRVKKRAATRGRVHEGAVARAVQSLHGELESQLVRQVNALNSGQVIRLVMDILTALGQGGPGATVSSEGLGDIGGAVLKDAVGISRVYVTVTANSRAGIEDLQRFKLGLEAARAKAGVLVSPAGVTDTAVGFAAGASKRISIMDFEELAYLMVHSGTGVIEDSGYITKRLDESFFDIPGEAGQ